MDVLNVNATVHIRGADEAAEKTVALIEKINEAKTLARELASLLDGLGVKVEL